MYNFSHFDRGPGGLILMKHSRGIITKTSQRAHIEIFNKGAEIIIRESPWHRHIEIGEKVSDVSKYTMTALH
jgi:hypothetical protein